MGRFLRGCFKTFRGVLAGWVTCLLQMTITPMLRSSSHKPFLPIWLKKVFTFFNSEGSKSAEVLVFRKSTLLMVLSVLYSLPVRDWASLRAPRLNKKSRISCKTTALPLGLEMNLYFLVKHR